MLRSLIAALMLMAAPLWAEAPDDLADRVAAAVQGQVLPGYAQLAEQTLALNDTAQASCAGDDPELRAAWAAAFDAWVRVSHLRFGPSERDNRAFALAFWPDTRGKTPKALAALIASEDPAVDTPEDLAKVSIAAQGFYALEFLLYDQVFVGDAATAAYRCRLVQGVAAGIHARASALRDDWELAYAGAMMHPSEGGPYRDMREAAQELYKAVMTGLQFTSDARLGRPLGSFERPRPMRAEARRSGRSLRHVVLSLEATRDLALALAGGDTALKEKINYVFADALGVAGELDDPVFAGVADPMGRLKVEILQQRVDLIRQTLAAELGPSLGVAEGFNALDGD